VTAAGSTTAGAAGTAAGWVVAAPFASASPVDDALGIGQLVPQAALEATAEARQLRWVQTQVLLLGHLDRDWLERRQKSRAAKRPTAGSVPPEHLGFVAHADLPHFDPRVKLRRQLAYQLPKVDPSVRREVEDQSRTIERELDACQPHSEAALADLEETNSVRLTFALLLLEPHRDVVPAGKADARRGVDHGTALFDQLRNPTDDRRQRGTTLGLHDDLVARPRDLIGREIGEYVRLHAADRCQLDGHDAGRIRRVHSCNTTQSATILIPALPFSATSA
jgi:hypothetical protein